MDNNKILRYLEGQLTGQDKEAFEALIESDSELQLEVEMLGNLIDNEPKKNPPYQLRQKIYDRIGINNESFMDIIIKKTSNILNIINGDNYLVDIQPAFVTRSNKKSLLFKKDMNGYKIFCDLYVEDNQCFLDLSAFDSNEKELKNIKFSLKQKSNNLLEKYTDSDGHTGSFKINSGNYEININKNNTEIGNIQINIS